MFKRLLVLAVALALFVTAFFIYFHVSDSRIEAGFRKEREEFQVQGVVLTAADPTAIPGNVVTPTPASSAPAATPSPAAAPATDTLIGPVPPTATPDSSATPASSTTPDNSTAPAAPATPDGSSTPGAPATPDSSAMPATPAEPATPDTNAPAAPSSTFIYPGLSHLPMVVLAAYNSHGLRVQSPAAPTGTVTTPALAAPKTIEAAATNTEASTNAETVAPVSTNTAATASTNTATEKPRSVPASVIVLGFHQFTGPGVPSKNIYSMQQDVFETEMKYLKDNNYHVVPLSDVVRFIKHEIGMQPNSVAITIDDGYKSSIVWAAPVLKKYGFPWTFFIYPDFITVAEGKGAASWNDLLELQAEGVDIECHSKSHPNLPSHTQKFHGTRHLLTPEEYAQFLNDETAGAKETLEKHMGKPIKYFAYPYGAYNKQVEATVVVAGFEAVFTVAGNPVHPNTNIFSIGRYVITKPDEKSYAAYLRQGALAVADATPPPGATITDPRPIISAVLGYAGTIDPNSISAEVRDFGEVRHDYDPKTSTVRLYLPRDIIQPTVIVDIRAKDATSGQKMVASWRFNYSAVAPGLAHKPIPETLAAPGTNTAIPSPAPIRKTAAPAKASGTTPAIPARTNAPATTNAPAEVNGGEHEEIETATNAAPVPTEASNAIPVVPAAPASNAPPAVPEP